MPELRLEGCTHEAADYACRTWHYSGKMPAGKLVKVGVWEGGKFIGAVIFGRGANNNIGSKYGLNQTEVCELVRVALRAHVTPVSKIMAVAVKLLRRQSPGLRLLVSYADPDQGHHGGIYQACGWAYSGPSQEQRELVVGGQEIHKRSANAKWGTASPDKLRKLTGLSVEWGPMRWKHTYLLPLDGAMRAQIESLRKPYPKRQDDNEVAHGSERAPAHTHRDQARDGQPRETEAERSGGAADRRTAEAVAHNG